MADDNYRRLGSACHCEEPLKKKPPVEPRPTFQPIECPACRSFFTPKREAQKVCSQLCRMRVRRGNKPRKLREYKCVVCEGAFESIIETAMYCSRKCKTAGWREKNPERTDYQPTLCAYWTGYCTSCGDAMGGKRERLRCARCQRASLNRAACEAAYATNQARHKAAGRVTHCEQCGSCFCPLYGSSNSSLCAPCAAQRFKDHRRAGKKLRDALQRGAAGGERVEKRKVFERDGWACRLCGISTPVDLIGTYEHNAPELDHSIPVSRGGLHTYANTQCLCRSCNGWKAARTMEEAIEALTA